MTTVRELLKGCKDLDRLDAEVLLAEVLSKGRAWLYAHDDAELKSAQVAQFHTFTTRRRAGEPIAYLIGWCEFWSLRLKVTSATLIPRPETELLVDLALARLPKSAPSTVLDLGVGSGAIALAIATERPSARLTATDNNPLALDIARFNAQQLGVSNITFGNGDWYQPVQQQRFDLIISNPPYVAANDRHLQQGDCRYEPRSALSPGGDGLGAFRAIIGGARAHLESGGQLLLEHGYDQREAVLRLILGAGLEVVEACDDLAGLPRVLVSRMT